MKRGFHVRAIAALIAIFTIAAMATASESKSVLYRVDASTATDARSALGPVIEDYGSFQVLAVAADDSTAASAAAIGAQPLSTQLHAREFAFDPLDAEPLAEITEPRARFDSLEAAGGDFVVQFTAPIRAQWLADLRAAGLQPLQYLPQQAYLVQGSAAAATRLRAHSKVRYVGAWHPAYRLSPALAWVIGAQTSHEAAYGQHQRARYELAVSRYVARVEWEASIAALGGSALQSQRIPGTALDLLRVDLSPDALIDVARLSGVVSIDPYRPLQIEDERAAQIVAGNYLSTTELEAPGYYAPVQFGADGTNVTVAVSDDGLGIPGDGGYYVSFFNATNGPLRGATSGASGHGHLQGSIIAGSAPVANPDPLGYSYGAGIATGANLLNIPILRAGYSGTDADAANDTVVGFGPNGIRATISNNSWGAGVNTNAYDAYAALYDGLVRDASLGPAQDPLLIVFSAGNEGSFGLTRPKMSKNSIAVGASDNLRPELMATTGFGLADNIDDVPGFSSRGPAAGGRVKPDIAAPGEVVTGGRSGPNILTANINLYHRYSSGTSQAAAQISGAAAIYTHKWKLDHAGSVPSPAMIKAALLNGAVDMQRFGSEAPIPNGAEGWGRVNLKNVLNSAVPTYSLDQSERLQAVGQTVVWSGAVADASRELRIALVWTDAPGITDPPLVNDLDLSVKIGTNTYRGNAFSGGLSVTGGNADTVNNVEKILLPAGISAGTQITITVRASALNGDGVPGAGTQTDQDYALVCLNCVATPAFSVSMPLALPDLCVGTSLNLPVSLAPVLGFNMPVQLSATGLGPSAMSFVPNPVPILPGSSQFQLQASQSHIGEQILRIEATAGIHQRELNLPVFIAARPAAPPQLSAPIDGALSVMTRPQLQWNAAPEAFDYLVELSTHASFDTLIDSATLRGTIWTPSTELQPQTRYFWRVFARNACAGRYAELFADGLEPVAVGPSATESENSSFTTGPGA